MRAVRRERRRGARDQRLLLAGHVPAANFLGCFHPASFITFLRNPVDRVVSTYKHLVRFGKYHGSFVDFCELRGHINTQSRFLSGIDPRDIGFIGLTEYMPDMLPALSHHLGVELRNRRDNVGRRSDAPSIDERTRAIRAMTGTGSAPKGPRLDELIARYPVRGLKGAVGTQLDQLTLFGGDAKKVEKLEQRILAHLGFKASLFAVGQVYPRSLDFEVVSDTLIVDPVTGHARIVVEVDEDAEGFLVKSEQTPSRVRAAVAAIAIQEPCDGPGTRGARTTATAPDDARRRMAAQATDADRRKVADVILDNSGSEADLEPLALEQGAQRLPGLRRNGAARRALRQDPSLRFRDGRGKLPGGAHHRGRERAGRDR